MLRRKISRVRGCADNGACCFNRMVRGGITDKVIFRERTEGSEEVSHIDTQGKSIPGIGNSQCEGS